MNQVVIRSNLKLKIRRLLGLISIAALLLKIELGLRLVGYQRLRNTVLKLKPVPVSFPFSYTVHIVDRISRYIPKSACLGRSIAIQTILYHQGKPSSLVIGVAKDKAGKVIAHAWLTYQGEPIYGFDSAQSVSYSPIKIYHVGAEE